jgi:hypothetical protein
MSLAQVPISCGFLDQDFADLFSMGSHRRFLRVSTAWSGETVDLLAKREPRTGVRSAGLVGGSLFPFALAQRRLVRDAIGLN